MMFKVGMGKPFLKGLCSVVCASYSTPPWQCESSHRQYIKGGVWLCVNKTSFVDSKILISCNFHVLQNILYFPPHGLHAVVC